MGTRDHRDRSEHPREYAGPPEVRLGVSSCVLGRNVRFDGGHGRNRFVTDDLGGHVTFLPVCPEVELGLGVPRETLRLVRQGDEVRLVAPRSGMDHTEAMRELAEKRARQLAELDIAGFVLKSRSPTCGLERVRVYQENGIPLKNGQGLFAEALEKALPSLPVEEDGRLNDPGIRQRFLKRVFAYARARALFGGEWRIADLLDFHRREKLMLKAHDPVRARRLGAIVAAATPENHAETRDAYFPLFMDILAKRIPAGAHDSMLQRMLGGLRRCLDPRDHRQVLATIAEYRRGLVPLSVPRAMIAHYSKIHTVAYLLEQTYFAPYPRELDPSLNATEML